MKYILTIASFIYMFYFTYLFFLGFKSSESIKIKKIHVFCFVIINLLRLKNLIY